MSRIHDALKKAEEDKLAGKISAPTPMLDAMERVSTPEPVDGHVLAPKTAMPVGEADEHEGAAASADTLLQRCSKVHWRPKRNVALFLESTAQVAPGMEEFRTLRARLFQMRAKRPLKTILVSSALPDEGKSFVSGNLAQVFARQRGGRTLLIDCDLRKPQLHEMLGAPDTPGVSEYLQGKADEFSIIQKAGYDELFFIPGGQVGPTTPELIGNGKFKLLLQQLSPLFNWIIVDSSPTAPVSDACRVAEFCDGVVLVVRAGATPSSLAQQAKKEFRDANILGVVLNRVSKAEHSHSKYYYSQYGYGKRS